MSAETVDEYGFAFYRAESRKSRLKRLCDCGHWIDGTEPYRYQVWKLRPSQSRGVEQRLDCEFCARTDNSY
jgi:hypothetical protein